MRYRKIPNDLSIKNASRLVRFLPCDELKTLAKTAYDRWCWDSGDSDDQKLFKAADTEIKFRKKSGIFITRRATNPRELVRYRRFYQPNGTNFVTMCILFKDEKPASD